MYDVITLRADCRKCLLQTFGGTVHSAVYSIRMLEPTLIPIPCRMVEAEFASKVENNHISLGPPKTSVVSFAFETSRALGARSLSEFLTAAAAGFPCVLT